MPEQIRRAEREADRFFDLALKRDERQVCVDAGATDHVLDRFDFDRRETFFGEQLRGELGAALDMRDSIFRAGAFGVLASLKVPGVMEQNGEQAKLEHALRQGRFCPREVSAMQ